MYEIYFMFFSQIATKPTLKATKADKNQLAEGEEDDFEEEEVAGGYQQKFNDDDFM